MTDTISNFFQIEDKDSRFTLAEVIERANDIYGIDITTQFCLFTGKPIGDVYPSELEFALSEETSEDLDDLADAMMVRVVASMRPSPALNKPDHMTLSALAAKHPVDAICYFINRLNGTRDLLVKRDGQNSFGPLLARINDYQRWAGLAKAGMDLTPWIHWLAELDAKMNLHDLKAPRISVDRLNKMFVSFDGVSLFSFVTLENHKDVYSIFEKWVFRNLGVYDERDRLATAQANWFRGNRMAVTTFTKSWIENPVIAKRASDAKIKHSQKPGQQSEKPAKTPKPQTAKQVKLGAALALLDSLGKAVETPAPVEAPKPVATTSVVGRLKLNLVKKG